MTNAIWYLARGSGLTSLMLLTLVVVLGIGSRSGRPVFGLPRFAVASLHKNASLLAITFLAVHVFSLLLDPFAQLTLVNLVVPFTSTYRPLWVGLGALAFDLIIALIITSLVRQRLGARSWRAIHWLAYACWPFALLHGLKAGSDASTGWMRITTLACASAGMAALAWRVTTGFSETAQVRVR